MLDPVLKPDQPQPTGLQSLLKDWGIDAGNDIVLDVSGMGRLIGTDESVPVAASYPAHPITAGLRAADGLPARAFDGAGRRRRQRAQRAEADRDRAAQLGRNRISRA